MGFVFSVPLLYHTSGDLSRVKSGPTLSDLGQGNKLSRQAAGASPPPKLDNSDPNSPDHGQPWSGNRTNFIQVAGILAYYRTATSYIDITQLTV